MSKKNDSQLMLDVDQARELKMAFRRNGWTNAWIKALSEKDTLGKVLDFLSENKRELTEINSQKTRSKEHCTCDAKLLDSQSEEASEDVMLMHQQLKLDMEKALSRLNVDEFCVVQLFFGINSDTLSIEEIAKLQDMTVKEVTKIKNDAIEHIRQSKVFRYLLREYSKPPKVCRV